MSSNCARCNSEELRASRLKSGEWYHMVLLEPFRCRGCNYRFWKPRRFVKSGAFMGAAFVLGTACLAVEKEPALELNPVALYAAKSEYSYRTGITGFLSMQGGSENSMLNKTVVESLGEFNTSRICGDILASSQTKTVLN